MRKPRQSGGKLDKCPDRFALYSASSYGTRAQRGMLARRPTRRRPIWCESLGGAFFGESMFSRERDASKVALVHLVARLKAAASALLDAQFLTNISHNSAQSPYHGSTISNCLRMRFTRRQISAVRDLLPGSFGQVGNSFLGAGVRATWLSRRSRCNDRRHLARLVRFATDHPDIIERVLQPVQRWARRACIRPEKLAAAADRRGDRQFR